MPQGGSEAKRTRRGPGTGGAPVGRALLLAWVGLIVGAVVDTRSWGAVSGALVGVLAALWLDGRRRLAEMAGALDGVERRLAGLERAAAPDTGAGAVDRAAAARPAAPTSVSGTPPIRSASPASAPAPTASAEPTPAARGSSSHPSSGASAAPGDAGAAPPSPRAPGPIDRALEAARALLLGGNTVVRVGVLVLLVGVALLARYAAENAMFPIEARLAASAAIGLALTVVGYRQRAARPGFGTSLQGGGVAALYLVVFFAYRIYGLVPAGLAFALFVGVALACGVLAVVQSAQPLLVIGSLGGFAAPVLASSGQGSHVFLFGFYLVLNAGVAGVAWFRSWRLPPVLAFLCTYGVASAWGVLRYRPDDYATTQPFVVAFFVLFTAIAILHARRQPARLRGPIDGTLVFGTPLLSLLAQAKLVSDTELGLAVSAAALGLVYAGLATWTWRAFPPAMHMLAEAFVALAVGFATMAIPFAFEASLTVSIAWALEGAGLYWVGWRQGRRLARFSGIGLQALAAVSFFVSMAVHDLSRAELTVIANGRFLSCAALALAGMFIARQGDARRDEAGAFEWTVAQALGAWGLLWWGAGVLAEIDQFVPRVWQASAVVAAVGATALVLETVAAASAWRFGRALAVVAIPALALLVPATLDHQPHLLAHGGWAAWPFALAAVYHVLARLEADSRPWIGAGYAAALWLLVGVVSFAFGGLAESALDGTADWGMGLAGGGGAAVWLAAVYWLERGRGPFGRHVESHLTLGMMPLVAAAALWWLVANGEARGDAAPLPHLPVLNPVDASLGLIAVAVLAWWAAFRSHLPAQVDDGRRRLAISAGGAALFVWLNAILARAVHQWTGVRFGAGSLWDSVAMQSSLSITWTVVALGGMLLSTRRGWRSAWIVFACLLAAVVVKLFTVDLSRLGTVTKIGTFLVVGLLLLVVGYLSPVPPSGTAGDGSASADDADETTPVEGPA
jgi:uncharacterized membrane protein